MSGRKVKGMQALAISPHLAEAIGLVSCSIRVRAVLEGGGTRDLELIVVVRGEPEPAPQLELDLGTTGERTSE